MLQTGVTCKITQRSDSWLPRDLLLHTDSLEEVPWVYFHKWKPAKLLGYGDLTEKKEFKVTMTLNITVLPQDSSP